MMSGGLGTGTVEALAGITILERRPNTYSSTFPAEILLCRLPDGSERELLWKREGGREHNAQGHRGGVSYEAAVYRNVLQPLSLSSPKFFGSGEDREGHWLLVEYVGARAGIEEAPSPPQAMRAAAHWIGLFHAVNERRVQDPDLGFLRVYDQRYYAQWANRTAEFAGHWHQRLPWLAGLCRRFPDVAARWTAEPPTVIHGEYTPHNVLLRGEGVYPVDWESAAVAIGEVDLICLTDKWPAEVAQECEQEYRRSRWPEGAPAGCDRTLEMARLYWHLRWLGDRPEWTVLEKAGARFESLRRSAEHLGLLE